MRNKYSGTCYRCGKTVEAGSGYFERHSGSWRVQHKHCCEKARQDRQELIKASELPSEEHEPCNQKTSS